MSQITQKGATGPLALRANGVFQSTSALATTPGAYGTSFTSDVAQLVGTRWDLNDGREVILVSTTASSNVTPGYLMQDAAIVAGTTNLQLNAFVAYATLANTAATLSVTVGNVITANQFQGGYAVVNDGGTAGQGQTLRISSHPAAASGANLTITLEDSPNVALTTSSYVCLVPAHGAGVVVQPTTPTNVPCGVGLYPIAASSYGFLVSKGIVSALSDNKPANVGTAVAASVTTPGATTAQTATNGNIIGMAQFTAVSAKSYPVYVNI